MKNLLWLFPIWCFSLFELLALILSSWNVTDWAARILQDSWVLDIVPVKQLEGRGEPVWWVMANASITTKKLLSAPLAKQWVTELSRISGWGFWMIAEYTFPLEEWSCFGLIIFLAINDDNEQLCSVVAACNSFANQIHSKANRCILKLVIKKRLKSKQDVQICGTVQPLWKS